MGGARNLPVRGVAPLRSFHGLLWKVSPAFPTHPLAVHGSCRRQGAPGFHVEPPSSPRAAVGFTVHGVGRPRCAEEGVGCPHPMLAPAIRWPCTAVGRNPHDEE